MTAGIANHPLGINNRAIKVGPGVTDPPLLITNTSIPDAVVNAAYTTTMTQTGAIGQQGRSAVPAWSAVGLPAGLTIDPVRGIISGSSTAAAGSYPVFITVADGVHAPTTVGYMLVLTSTSGLTITTATLPAGQIGASYSATVAAANGLTPYQFAGTVNGVAMPAEGLDIGQTTGVITGSPSGSPGTKTIVITVTDSNNVSVPRTYTPNFTAPAISITTAGAMTAAVNGDSSWSFSVAAQGGTGARTWSITSGAPSGMTIGNLLGNGLVVGPMDDTAGNYSVHIKVVDSLGQQDTVTLTLALSDAAGSPPAFAGHMLGLVLPPAAGFNTGHLNTLIAAQPDLTIIRNQLDWSGAQPSRTADPDFTSAVQSMQTFRSRLNSGPDSLILVMSPPAWARPPGSGQHAYPIDPDDFGYFCGKAAEYLKNTKPTMRQRWEIFNEPNNSFFTDGVDPASPAHVTKYARCLQAAYKAIKAVAPNALVSTGGTAPSPVDARKGHNWLPLVLDAMKAERTAGRYTKPAAGWHPWCACDRVSHHPYSTGRLTNGTVVDAGTNLPSNAFGHDTPLMAQVVVAKVGVEMIFWQTEAGVKNHHNATTGEGWTGGPYTHPHSNIAGKTQNWDINSGPEAYAALNKALDYWFGRVNWPAGDKLAVWPDVNARKSTRTELYCYFHMGHDIFSGDFAVSIDGIWDYNDVLKRVAGASNDLFEAFTTYVVP